MTTIRPGADPEPTRRRGRPGYDLESLLQTVVEVFNERGFDGTSMEDLSQRLGISKSAIYHHVSSKNELLELAIGQALDGLADAVERTRRLRAAAIVRLDHLIRASVTVLVKQKPFVTLLLRVRGNTDVERRALQRRRAFDAYVAELVEQAAAEGAVRPDIDPALTARLLFGMVNSLTEWVRPVPGDEADVARLADAICLITFGGIRNQR
ncbi:TetR/AcrR family transcriptional regulator [Nakamurella lactea]|uniref:TetR/AcrR family transcriptional regulator n=1 Tax=Nakamurella lactea TaxID=459515 RepID=UPI000411EF92|nr:TetR family transcriptional regulator [Nakamurella lactea]